MYLVLSHCPVSLNSTAFQHNPGGYLHGYQLIGMNLLFLPRCPPLHAQSAMRIWMQLIQTLCLVHVDFTCAYSATKRFLNKMVAAQAAENNMLQLMWVLTYQCFR